MSTLKTTVFCFYIAALPIILYLLFNFFEADIVKIFVAALIAASGIFVVVMFNSHLNNYYQKKSQMVAEQNLLFMTQMPENATRQVSETTLYFEDGSKRVTYRQDDCKWLNTPDKKRIVRCHGNVNEYDKDENLVSTKYFMS